MAAKRSHQVWSGGVFVLTYFRLPECVTAKVISSIGPWQWSLRTGRNFFVARRSCWPNCFLARDGHQLWFFAVFRNSIAFMQGPSGCEVAGKI